MMIQKQHGITEKQISYAVSLISRQKGIVSIKELATEACLGYDNLSASLNFIQVIRQRI